MLNEYKNLNVTNDLMNDIIRSTSSLQQIKTLLCCINKISNKVVSVFKNGKENLINGEEINSYEEAFSYLEREGQANVIFNTEELIVLMNANKTKPISHIKSNVKKLAENISKTYITRDYDNGDFDIINMFGKVAYRNKELIFYFNHYLCEIYREIDNAQSGKGNFYYQINFCDILKLESMSEFNLYIFLCSRRYMKKIYYGDESLLQELANITIEATEKTDRRKMINTYFSRHVIKPIKKLNKICNSTIELKRFRGKNSGVIIIKE